MPTIDVNFSPIKLKSLPVLRPDYKPYVPSKIEVDESLYEPKINRREEDWYLGEDKEIARINAKN